MPTGIRPGLGYRPINCIRITGDSDSSAVRVTKLEPITGKLATMTATTSLIRERAALAKAASRKLASIPTGVKDAAILRIADLLESDAPALLEANQRDLEAGRQAGLDPYFLDRLTLKPAAVAADTRTVARLPDPVGEVFDARTLPNGLQIGRRRVPLGVLACIYESRPNVTVDIAVLALKSGNASILRGGKEARNTNAALGDLIQRALADAGAPGDAVQVVSDPDRAHVDELLKSHDLIDIIVPRGGSQLIDYVRQNATMPVVAHGEAVVQIYVDRDADVEKSVTVIDNAKTRRYSICNAVDTLLVHEAIAGPFLDALLARWGDRVAMIADDRARAIIGGHPQVPLESATVETWQTEHLAMRLGVRIVANQDEATQHIEEYGSHHSDAIL
ncbi:MAG TPA: glutamate-5-semialdehyde dehydrogenase, partial [Tepidiformaceae bacterium]|nr:glutamate-5-semialdehyde dehydrogenase [Tepidiformaceae bacterium]